jgi:hypothetical protein
VLSFHNDTVRDNVNFQFMNFSVHVKTVDLAVKEDRMKTIETVIAQFGEILPDRRMLCFFDDEDSYLIKQRLGKVNRGIYSPLSKNFIGSREWHLLPLDVQELVFPEDSPVPHQAFDHLIYLHGTTCMKRTSLIMTFAHELQHFLQHEENRTLWAASAVLSHLEKDFYESSGLKMFQIPTETEARIVAKRVAETICGTEDVDDYIESRISENATPEDVEDWRFVRDLVTDRAFNLSVESKQVFRRLLPYREPMEEALDRARGDDDFRNLDLSALMTGQEP